MVCLIFILTLFTALCPISVSQFWHGLNETLIGNGGLTNYASKTADHMVRQYHETIRAAWAMNDHNRSHDDYYTNPLLNINFEEAMHLLYRYQNPTSCEGKKFLISRGYRSGFGSEIHVDTVGLAVAMNLDRIYIPMLKTISDWRNPVSICSKRNGLQCYFQPWTNCTISSKDLSKAASDSPYGRVRMFKANAADVAAFTATGVYNVNQSMDEGEYEHERYLYIELPVHFFAAKLIPKQMLPYVDPLPISYHNRHYWWRSVATAYLTRPTSLMTSLIKHHSIEGLNELNGKCVAMYVRHGDKGLEMKLPSFAIYAEVGDKMWTLAFGKSETAKKTIMLGTETPEVLAAAFSWGKTNNWTIAVNHLQLEIFHRGKRSNLSEALSRDADLLQINPEAKSAKWKHLRKKRPHSTGVGAADDSKKPFITALQEDGHIRAEQVVVIGETDIETGFKSGSGRRLDDKSNSNKRLKSTKTSGPQRDPNRFKKFASHADLGTRNAGEHSERANPIIPEEFASMIVNLADFMKCDAFVCTLRSNYCRVLDELRSTVARKSAALFADISVETCEQPPCYIGCDKAGARMQTFDWRN